MSEEAPRDQALIAELCSRLRKLEQEQARVRESEARLRLLFNHTFQFLGLASREGILLEVNQTILTLAGLSEKEVLGLPLWDVDWGIRPTDQERMRQGVQEAGEGHFVRFEVQTRRKQRVPLTVDFSITPVRDEAGRVIFLIPEGHDVTERNRLETELMTALSTKKELDEVKARFIERTSHEFRTPLSIILSSAELLRNYSRQLTDIRKDELLQRIEDSVRRMSDLLDNGYD